MVKYTVILCVLLLFCGCQETEQEIMHPELLEFPRLDWNAEIEEVEELFPGGKAYAYENMPGQEYYDVEGIRLWGDSVSLSFDFLNGHISTLWCFYEDQSIDPDKIREKIRLSYGDPWKEYTWQEGKNTWKTEERMIDRLDEETALLCGEELENLIQLPGDAVRFQGLYRLYEELCMRNLVTLTFDDEEMVLKWRPYWYTMVAKYSEGKKSGKVPMEQLMALSEEGTEVLGEDGVLQEIRLSWIEEDLEDLKNQLGSPSERFLAFDMPEDSIFWVSEEQVYQSFAKEAESDLYDSVALFPPDPDDELPYWHSAKMYRTPLVMLYWDEEAKELVWDLTGQANLERVRAELS